MSLVRFIEFAKTSKLLRFQALPFFVALPAVLGCLVSIAVPASLAKVALPAVFSDGLVLQRDQPDEIWGSGKPGEKVEVQIAAQRKATSADAQGRWKVVLSPLRQASELELIVIGENKLVLKHVAVGDVWVCSGQSNIGVPICRSDASKADLSDVDRLKIHVYSQIRNVQTGKVAPGSWTVIDKSKLAALSTPAIPYLFARQLQKANGVPTAILLLNSGGAPLETFLPPETVKRCGVRPDSILPAYKVGENYKDYLQPFLRFGIKGILWYQGEANFCTAATYKRIFPALLSDWRKQLVKSDVPIFFVQLPNHGNRNNSPVDEMWAELREAQSAALSQPDVHMVVAIDTAKGEPALLHPVEKRVIAQRLSDFAMLREKSKSGRLLKVASPTFKSLRIDGGRLIVTIDNGIANGDLKLNDSQSRSFALAAADRRFHWAHATVLRTTKIGGASVSEIQLKSDSVTKPVAARYAWADNPVSSVSFGSLPLAPFRTDRWPSHPQINPADLNPR
jgi:sialate O-acetylesterase